MRWAVILVLFFLAGSASVVAGEYAYPLHTRAGAIVDRRGAAVALRGVNWFGAESKAFVVGGLDRQPLASIAATVRRGGFDMVRLLWSNEMVETDPIVDSALLAANPALRGKHALDIFDAVIDALARENLMVVLDNHRSRADWCCDEAHGDGLWHTPDYPEDAWRADWRTMAARYRGRPNVVAAELRNEIRPDPSQDLKPSWGDGDPATDWRAAAGRGGDAVLTANPQLLIVVGGIGYQENLIPVRAAPVRLPVPNRLVYAAHDYAWWHPAAELSDDKAFAAAAWRRWGYVRARGHAYTAPVVITEWGGCVQPDGDGKPCAADRAAFVLAFARYAKASRIGWIYWPLNATQMRGYGRSAGAVETYGLLDRDWAHYADANLVKRLTGTETVSGPN